MEIKINLTNKWFYTLISLVIILFAVGIVWALNPGDTPNPGHPISQLGIPAPCTSGQVLSYNVSNWICASSASGLEVKVWCERTLRLSYGGVCPGGWSYAGTIDNAGDHICWDGGGFISGGDDDTTLCYK